MNTLETNSRRFTHDLAEIAETPQVKVLGVIRVEHPQYGVAGFVELSGLDGEVQLARIRVRGRSVDQFYRVPLSSLRITEDQIKQLLNRK